MGLRDYQKSMIEEAGLKESTEPPESPGGSQSPQDPQNFTMEGEESVRGALRPAAAIRKRWSRVANSLGFIENISEDTFLGECRGVSSSLESDTIC